MQLCFIIIFILCIISGYMDIIQTFFQIIYIFIFLNNYSLVLCNCMLLHSITCFVMRYIGIQIFVHICLDWTKCYTTKVSSANGTRLAQILLIKLDDDRGDDEFLVKTFAGWWKIWKGVWYTMSWLAPNGAYNFLVNSFLLY